ncbi:MAG: rRNA maturation RNase YbeY [Bacteroidota bacterium]|nr:rRNA maturation RNase YbeY [Bacteroidota bacterium]
MCRNKSSFVLSIDFTIFGNGMMQTKTQISFHFLIPFKLPQRKKLKLFLHSLFQEESYKLTDLSYVFCDDDYLLDLNRRFLKHDYYTDILSFPGSKSKDNKVSGEIYISVERVRENAKVHSSSFREEIHRVIFHGALHLCHYKDKTRKEQARMRRKEDDCLIRYFK